MKYFVMLLIAISMFMAVPCLAADVPTEIGPVVLKGFSSGDTMSGVAVGFHVIPTADNKYQKWAAEHITLDVLAVGTALDATKATLGGSLNLLSPEGKIKLGLTYITSPNREWCGYVGYTIFL